MGENKRLHVATVEARFNGAETKKHRFEGELARVTRALRAYENYYANIPQCYFISTTLDEVKNA
jgi:hypothetical protein